ncbi:MAG: hypothetical protein H6607_07545 [Flavobacteriales bacterium]|nr:hypothetical protein [Flavobacteriales bacterium]
MNFEETYRRFPDRKLEHIAKYEFDSLQPEAKIAITSELKRRNLDSEVKEFHKILEEDVTKDEFRKIANLYRSCDCPYCGKTNKGINVVNISYLYFIVVLIFWGKLSYVGCSSCLEEQLNDYKKKLKLLALIVPFQTILSFITIHDVNKAIKNIQGNNTPTREYLQYVRDNVYSIKEILRKMDKI